MKVGESVVGKRVEAGSGDLGSCGPFCFPARIWLLAAELPGVLSSPLILEFDVLYPRAFSFSIQFIQQLSLNFVAWLQSESILVLFSWCPLCSQTATSLHLTLECL